MFMFKIKPNKKARKIKQTKKRAKKCNLYFRDACKRLGSHI